MSQHLADMEIGVRAAEEILRLFPSLSERAITERLGFNRHTIQNWKSGMTPSGHAIAVLYYAGCDIPYILTGRRGKN